MPGGSGHKIVSEDTRTNTLLDILVLIDTTVAINTLHRQVLNIC